MDKAYMNKKHNKLVLKSIICYYIIVLTAMNYAQAITKDDLITTLAQKRTIVTSGVVEYERLHFTSLSVTNYETFASEISGLYTWQEDFPLRIQSSLEKLRENGKKIGHFRIHHIFSGLLDHQVCEWDFASVDYVRNSSGEYIKKENLPSGLSIRIPGRIEYSKDGESTKEYASGTLTIHPLDNSPYDRIYNMDMTLHDWMDVTRIGPYPGQTITQITPEGDSGNTSLRFASNDSYADYILDLQRGPSVKKVIGFLINENKGNNKVLEIIHGGFKQTPEGIWLPHLISEAEFQVDNATNTVIVNCKVRVVNKWELRLVESTELEIIIPESTHVLDFRIGGDSPLRYDMPF